MKATDRRTCPVCNTLLDSDSESCPVCALQGALTPEDDTSAIDSESELRFEHYQVLKNEDGTPIELGHGAMGVTYKALDIQLQRSVALKIINAKFIGDALARQRFVREARAAASVHHPNVATVHHLGEIGGDYFYVMEFVDGETLERLIRRSGKLEVNLALEVISQVAAGLTAIQKHHLVHRDVKPSNIMVMLEEGRLESVKIIDLGLAKGVAEQETISAVGSFAGTPGYASPEQFAGLGADIRSDLYSLGITLWEMLSGKLPFEGSAADLMYQHQHAALPTEKMRNISPPVAALLQVLLAKDPSQRFQNPAQLVEALTRIKNAIASKSVLAARVFISHSNKDKAIAEEICQYLESAGVPCWIAPRDIEPGTDWTEGIIRGITGSRIFVLVFSSHANNSENVRREMGRAFSLHLPVIPFRTEAIEPRDNLGYFLESVQWLDATKSPLERYFPVLTERVKALLSSEQALPNETPPATEPKQIPKAAPRRKRRLPVTAPIGAAAVVAAGIWFFVANSHKTNESNPIAASADIPAKSIAVLPFESLSENKNDSYFADGVQDEILNNLAKIAQLKVISRTSVMQYRGEAKRDLRQIANALGVANVLEGTVRREGNRVRVSTELIDAHKDQTIWADSYDRDLNGIFAIQSDVAQTIAAKLAATLSPTERKSIEAKPTENLEAYDLYLRANELISNSVENTSKSKDDLLEAVVFLNKAVRLDPNFALAYCASAYANDLLYWWFGQTPKRLALVDAAVTEALRLQPDLPEAHLAMARYLYRGFRNYDGARVQLAIAKRGLPNSIEVTAYEAFIDRRQGNMEKAIADLKAAVARDPKNLVSLQGLAGTLWATRQFDAAATFYDRLIELRPDRLEYKFNKAFTRFSKTGDLSAVSSAIAALPKSAEGDPDALDVALWLSLVDRDWTKAEQLIERMGSREGGYFSYTGRSTPAECYSVLMARLRKDQPEANQVFAEIRKRLNLRVLEAPQDASLLSALAVLDGLLNRKEAAISEVKRAANLLPISKDAYEGPGILKNLAVVYAWTGDLDLAFETLGSLTKIPYGIVYGDLKRDPRWEPLRQDPRYEKLLAELAPKD